MAKLSHTRNGYTAILGDGGYAYIRPKWDGKGREPEEIVGVMAKYSGEVIPGVRRGDTQCDLEPDVWSAEAKAALEAWMESELRKRGLL